MGNTFAQHILLLLSMAFCSLTVINLQGSGEPTTADNDYDYDYDYDYENLAKYYYYGKGISPTNLAIEIGKLKSQLNSNQSPGAQKQIEKYMKIGPYLSLLERREQQLAREKRDFQNSREKKFAILFTGLGATAGSAATIVLVGIAYGLIRLYKHYRKKSSPLEPDQPEIDQNKNSTNTPQVSPN